MNECPACGAATKEHHSFCRYCGAALKQPVIRRFFCTECGTPVKASQEVCHICQQPLAPEGLEDSASAAAGDRGTVNARGTRSWVIALLGGSVLVVLLVVWWLFPSKPPPRFSAVPPIPLESGPKRSTIEIESQPATASPSPVLADPDQVSPKQESLPTSEVLKKQLEELLQNMRVAQLNKDLDQYLNYYANNFPGLDKKRQITAKNWELYDYLDLEYKIDEVKLLITGNASAIVSWKIKYRNKGSEEIKYITPKYKILLSHELNKWRISKLELITKP